MSGRNKITWLASYPKSGNTWVRLLLGNLLALEDDQEGDRNFLRTPGISSSRSGFETLVGLNSYDLTDDEVDRLRPASYRLMAQRAQQKMFVKAHDAYHVLPHGEPLFPAECSQGAIYIVRDPLDVAVSFAHHRGDVDFEKTVACMNHPKYAMSGGNRQQLRQRMLDWSGHYYSWTRQTAIPVLLVRYEDLRSDTARELRRIAEFAGLTESDFAVPVATAVEASRFERLQQLEADRGFAERPLQSQRFFRSGQSGEGWEKLGENLQSQLIERHGDAMRELGYL